MTTTSVEPHLCPWCGEEFNATTSISENRGPEAGDLSICFYCTGLLKFDDKLRAVKLSGEEFQKGDPDIKDILIEAKSRILELRKKEMTSKKGED